MPNQNQILLKTKLHQPRLPHDIIIRTRLVELLNDAIDCPLILVSAPAGFGKTTLVCTWLEQMAAGQSAVESSLPAAWLSLDENDSEINLFLRYFIAALRTIYEEVCEETLSLLKALQQPSLDVLYATLSNELEALSGEVLLVLDDYHTLQGTEVHSLFIGLAKHWPKHLHLVLISRIDPPPLASLRAKEMISEIRIRDLRFTPQETVAYLSQAQIAPLNQNTLDLLEERLEGWPAGLHLAALSLRSEISQESVLSAISSVNTNITRYLVDKVLTCQVPAIQIFLLKTSILDRYCASLCEAVIGEIDPAWNVQSCLDWIKHSELFIIPLDNHRKWYRYHHLFQELLQQRLDAENGPDEVAGLHRLASTWFEEHGLFDEALQHALAAGDLDLATHQMIIQLCDVINREDRPTLERWLHMLPDEKIQREPGLLMIRAWALQFSWRLNLQANVLGQIEELLDSGGSASLPAHDLQILHCQILALRAQQAYLRNETMRAIDLCRQVLAILPSSWTFVRGGAMMYLGMSMQASGQAPAAERLLLDEYASRSDKTDVYTLRLLCSLGFIYLNTGRLQQASRIAMVMQKGAIHRRLELMKSWGDHFLGVVCYQHNELQAALQHFTQIFKNRFTAHASAYHDAVAGLALIHQILGESSEALRIVETVSQLDLEQTGREDERTCSLRARLMLLQGDLEGAVRWADTFTDLPPDQPLMWLEEPQLSRVHILVARGAVADLRLALQILGVLDEIADRTHNTRHKIEILALHAVALDAQGETSQASTELKQAVDLALVGGFMRVFVDLGRPMQRMLRRLTKPGHSVEMIHYILAAFPQDDQNPVSDARHPSFANSTLPEPLTPRELEILTLLQGPSSVKEIALELHISHETVKRHIANLYVKLGVNQRWKAVDRAEELNILPFR